MLALYEIMSLFNKSYAKYYDLIYLSKKYKEEADFFNTLIKKYGPQSSKDILSFGAGTLNYELFLSKKGYKIDGIELSPEMVRLGKAKIKSKKIKLINLREGNMMSFCPRKEYDVVLALFNIVSYCKGLIDMEKFVKNTANSLKKNGILIFDCWNFEVAHKDPPRNSWSKIKNNGRTLYKLVEVSNLDNRGSFTRCLELIVLKGREIDDYFFEKHILYTWRVDDLRKVLTKYGFEIKIISEFMHIKPISGKYWPMVIVARKK